MTESNADLQLNWFRQLVEAAPDAMIVVDRAGSIVLANHQAERMFGYPRAELLGQPIEHLVPERFRGRHVGHRQGFARAPTARPMGSGLELRGLHRDGHEIEIEISLSPIETPDGRWMASTIRDITERRRFEAQAQRTAAYLKSSVESITDAFLLQDERDKLVIVNSTARQLLGAALAGPVEDHSFGETLDAAFAAGTFDHPGQDRETTRARWLAYHADPTGSLELRTAEGRTLRVTERRTAEGGTVTVISDVSEDVAREAELRRAQGRAEVASAAKSEFLASMSHELRTPLNAVLGFTQLLMRDKKTPLNERQMERVTHVLRGGEHLLRLIDDVLDLSRIEAGRIPISTEAVNVREVLREVITTIEPMAARSEVHLELRAVSSPPMVRADRTRLAQILMNFGSNAIKYGKREGRVVFALRVGAQSLRVSVTDDGIGIPEAHKSKIFEPFQRAGQETGAIEGTGIGLAISKRLAELMGGRVGFTSREGEGSEFWVEVPLHAETVPAAPARFDEREREVLTSSSSRRTLVYIEDNPSNIAFMKDLLGELEGLELRTAPNAEIGIELCRAELPAAILMDINLPGMSGYEATRRLQEWPETRHIPIVALSAAAMRRDTSRAAEAGFYRYLTKPVKVDELHAVLVELLEPKDST